MLSISAAPLPRDPQHDRARAVLLIRDATTEHAQREELAAFAGVVAHDLRNPLAAIDGWTELLDDAAADGDLPPEVVREFIGRVRASSTRMHGLILHLLAHATSSNRNLSLTRLDLDRGREADRRSAATPPTSSPSAPIPPVHGDRVLIDQVLENLIGNALKYVAAGVRPRGRRPRLRGQPGHGPGDASPTTGSACPRGSTSRSSTSSTACTPTGYEGTGLGLAIARRIVTRHGGTIARPGQPGRRHGLRVHAVLGRGSERVRAGSHGAESGSAAYPPRLEHPPLHPGKPDEHAQRPTPRTPPPDRPEQPAAPRSERKSMSVTQVQKWVMSALAVTTILHLSGGPDHRRDLPRRLARRRPGRPERDRRRDRGRRGGRGPRRSTRRTSSARGWRWARPEPVGLFLTF